MPLPNPINTYRNLGVPRYGESEIRFQTTNDGWTFTKGSTNDGNFLVFRSNVAEGSTTQTADLLRITSGGGLLGAPNSSVNIWEITSGGFSKNLKKNHTSVSSATGSTLYVLPSSLSGQIISVDGGAEGLSLVLPRALAGLEFTIVQSSGLPSVVNVTSTGGAEDILLAGGGGSSLASTVDAVAPATTSPGFAARLVGLSTARWLCIPYVNVLDGTSASAEARGGWVAGTTVA